ncbi:MAG TPA: hypothetical protein VGD06_05765 [Acidobacteriota bacterium]|jgi:hypothetical protein
MSLSERTRRLLLMVLLAVLAAGIVYEQAHADDLDAACGNVCKEECAAAGGCRYFASFGCNCKFQCFDGTQGLRICMSSR